MTTARLWRSCTFAIACAAIAFAACPLPASPAQSKIPAAARTTLDRYLGALSKKQYATAFAVLADKDRAYFRSADNFASIFAVDEFRLDSYKVVGSRSGGALGLVALVSERIHFFDHAHQSPGSAVVSVAYGVLHSGGGYRIHDPYHPWRAVRPANAETTVNGLHVMVRTVSLFAQRVEVLLTFENVKDGFVTLLPYGRSVLRSDTGTVAHPIATKLSQLTDKQLFLGLRLAGHARYTGILSFQIATPPLRTVTLTLAPFLRDGADAPFEVALPAITLP